jgi:hypothetical protein
MALTVWFLMGPEVLLGGKVEATRERKITLLLHLGRSGSKAAVF